MNLQLIGDDNELLFMDLTRAALLLVCNTINTEEDKEGEEREDVEEEKEEDMEEEEEKKSRR